MGIRGWRKSLKRKVRMKIEPLIMTERMLDSVMVVLDCRDIISVNLGCLNVPGEGVGVTGWEVGVEGVVAALYVELDAAAEERAWGSFETRAVEVVDIVKGGEGN